jgi:hypothetical protein
MNGLRLVRIAKMTRVWVARDSANQPARNRAGPAWNTPIMRANVRKSNRLLSGPNNNMNLRMKPMSQCEGAMSCSGSTWSVGIVS